MAFPFCQRHDIHWPQRETVSPQQQRFGPIRNRWLTGWAATFPAIAETPSFTQRRRLAHDQKVNPK